MRSRRFARIVPVACAFAGAALGALVHTSPSPAQDGSMPAVRDAPSGAIAYTTAASCPSGWVAETNLTGRLVVGSSTNVGLALGNAMGDAIAPIHSHSVSANITIGGKRLEHAGCGSNGTGTSGTYPSSGETTTAESGAPLLQLRACRRQ